jgi:hypothetical protein
VRSHSASASWPALRNRSLQSPSSLRVAAMYQALCRAGAEASPARSGTQERVKSWRLFSGLVLRRQRTPDKRSTKQRVETRARYMGAPHQLQARLMQPGSHCPLPRARALHASGRQPSSCTDMTEPPSRHIPPPWRPALLFCTRSWCPYSRLRDFHAMIAPPLPAAVLESNRVEGLGPSPRSMRCANAKMAPPS